MKFDPAKLAEPITRVYEEITDQVIENLAAHFNFHTLDSPSAQWQIKKLAELGQVQKETVRIIAQKTKNNEEMVRIALQNSVDIALKDAEPELKKAAERGLLVDGGPLSASQSVKRVLDTYLAQAKEATNLVNTTMLESTLNEFRRIVSDVSYIEQAAKGGQKILNSETGKVITGVSSRQEAVKRSIKRIADNGLTGFVDRSGRHWTPEAYVNMDIRTTCGNVATEAVFARNEDYGNDLVWVPIKAGSRPLCYPWQGKVLSKTNRTGTVTDLFGNEHEIIPISSTSYGQPAGLFGINCGHAPPNTFTPGNSVIRGEVPDEEENKRQYAESQQQRFIERQIRYAKRDLMIAKKLGDKDGEKAAMNKLERYQSKMRQFINETGRTRRYDREWQADYNSKKDVEK